MNSKQILCAICFLSIIFVGSNAQFFTTDSYSNATTGLDPCYSNPCNSSQRCISDYSGNYTCECSYLYSPENCFNQTLANGACLALNPCRNGGTCFDYGYVDYYFCNCASNYYGKDCENYSFVCQSIMCYNGGTCVSTGSDTYYCLCVYPYYGGKCEYSNYYNQSSSTNYPPTTSSYISDPCQSAPCLYNGKCQIIVGFVYNTYKCYCTSDRTGYNCETPIDNNNNGHRSVVNVSFRFFLSLFNVFNSNNNEYELD